MSVNRLILLLLLIGTMFGSWVLVRRRLAPPVPPYLGVPAQRRRIDAIIAELQSETLDQSIRGLLEYRQYTYPNYHSPKKAAQVDLEVMFSNRRSVKVLQQLQALPPGARETRCREIFDTFLHVHNKTLEKIMNRIEDPGVPKSEYTMRETVTSLCLAMFATAVCASTDAVAEQFVRLDEVQEMVARRLAEKGDAYMEIQKRIMRERCTPDRRCQWNVLRQAAARVSGKGERTLAKIDEMCQGFSKNEIPVVAWDAHTTWFDVPRRMERIPIDTSKGVTSYVVLDWPRNIYLDSDQQRELVQRIRGVVLGGRGNTP